ncbi:pyridoxal-phosphate dependent enzyme [Pseudonocardia adelaidensis]|uniref:Diaminopropionate ammonia-lyase n=1 Tax=Pseudonocardia adelaidensis TaxID=648754 RepID=A0ABP9NWX1_9PSEU
MATPALWRRPGPPAGSRPRPLPDGLLPFHRLLPGYAPTPLVELPEVAARLRVGHVLVKDESDRLGLPAFKMLGASWAVARAVRARIGGTSLDPDVLRACVAESGATLLLCTATAGNHGRAVARTARLLGLPARIWVSAATPGHLCAAIEGEGADVVRVDGQYDDAVAAAHAAAAVHDDAVLVQDTANGANDGEVPGWIVEGYATLLHEIHGELGRAPDVLVVPVGVGSLALATATYGAAAILTVEPAEAACLLTSLAHGEPRTVRTGRTAMAGLNAGTVSAAAWPVLRDRVTAAVAVPDEAALAAAEQLHTAGVAAGACGGAALAGLERALADPGAREALGVDEGSCVAVLSTDGER